MMEMTQERKREHLDYAWKIAKIFSKDESTKVGALIVDPVYGEIIPYGTGYNGFPRGCNDSAHERKQRPEKYDWTEHAERNALFNVARSRLGQSTAILSYSPDMVSARAISSVGTKFVILPEGVQIKDTRVECIFKESGVIVIRSTDEVANYGLRADKIDKYVSLAGNDGGGAIFLSDKYILIGDSHDCSHEDPARMAIYNVARRDVSGCFLFATMMPCIGCSDGVILSGIKHVVTERPDFDRWNANFEESAQLFEKHGVTCEILQPSQFSIAIQP